MDVGQSAEAGAVAGIETFFADILGQFQHTSAGQSVMGGIDRYAFQRYLPWVIVGGVVIYLLAKD